MPGYLDLWAVLRLRNGETFPLARALCQRWGSISDATDVVMLWAAHALRRRCLILGDRGVGTKWRCLTLDQFRIPFCFRIRRDLFVERERLWHSVEDYARKAQPWGKIRVKGVKGWQKFYVLQSCYIFSRTAPREPGEPVQRKPFCVIALLPERKEEELFFLITNLSVRNRRDARSLIKLYRSRWGIETAFETCKRELGLGRFMVRRVKAIERLLDLLTLAYTVLIFLLVSRGSLPARLHQAVWKLLRGWSVWRHAGRLTVGKLREALALDGRERRLAWNALLKHSYDFS